MYIWVPDCTHLHMSRHLYNIWYLDKLLAATKKCIGMRSPRLDQVALLICYAH